MKKKKLKCGFCKKSFIPTKKKQLFCCQKCYKAEKKVINEVKDFPVFACQYCGQHTKLDFNPDEEKKRWAELRCPSCEKLRIDENEIGLLGLRSI